jgi:hypothetical protein
MRFQALFNRHRGADVVVCGLGPSIHGWEPPDGLITVGVNDIGRHFTPDYLLVIDHPGVFKKWLPDPRLQHILDTKPKKAFLTPASVGPTWAKHRTDGIPFMIASIPRYAKKWPGWHSNNNPQIHHTIGGSPLPACSIAGFLGAKRIGLLGIDLYDHHAFKNHIDDTKEVWEGMKLFLAKKGVELWNLSERSALTNIPPMSLEDFNEHRPAPEDYSHAQADTAAR